MSKLSVYQDRLGTNIGKAKAKGCFVFCVQGGGGGSMQRGDALIFYSLLEDGSINQAARHQGLPTEEPDLGTHSRTHAHSRTLTHTHARVSDRSLRLVLCCDCRGACWRGYDVRDGGRRAAKDNLQLLVQREALVGLHTLLITDRTDRTHRV